MNPLSRVSVEVPHPGRVQYSPSRPRTDGEKDSTVNIDGPGCTRASHRDGYVSPLVDSNILDSLGSSVRGSHGSLAAVSRGGKNKRSDISYLFGASVWNFLCLPEVYSDTTIRSGRSAKELRHYFDRPLFEILMPPPAVIFYIP